MLTKIKENSKLVISSSFFLVVAIILSYKLTEQRAVGIERDYHLAHLSLQLLKGGNSGQLEPLQKILKKRPNLRETFHPAIVQCMIDEKKIDEAKGVLKSGGDRLKLKTPYHQQFSHTTFVISEGDLVLALTESKNLQNELRDKKYDLLKAFNLLRIALLEKEVGTKNGELAAWAQVEALEAPLFSSLQEVFHVNNITLKDFINHRKSIL